MTFQAALAAKIAAALAFALIAAGAAIAAPAWALVLIAMAGVGVALAQPHPAHRSAQPRGTLSFVIGVCAVGAAWGLGGPAWALAGLVVWRAAAETIATESMLRDIARRAAPLKIERGLTRALHLAGAPALALAVLFGAHGGRVFGQSAFTLAPEAAIVIAALAGVALIDWAIRRLADWRMGTASRALNLHVGAHHALFLAIGLVAQDGAALIVGLIAWRILRHAPALPGLAPTSIPAKAERPIRPADQAKALAR